MAVDTNILPARYRGPKRIGRGGMGDIYRATDESLGRAVAVKVLGDQYAQDESVRERFSREALAAARLSGRPHVITIFDVGEWEGRPYIVMEYLGGGSLDDAIRQRGAVDPGQAVEWLEQAGTALDAAHAEGVVHRDVKPANLLLDRDGNVHVADFGVASAAGLDSMTRTGTVVGTAGYLSPEQALGHAATAASDLYGLGVLAFELLTGRRPFSGDTAAAEASAHIHAPIPSISGFRHELPRELDPVFERALAKDPRARYPSAAEFVADLRHALHDAAGVTAVVPPAPLTPAPGPAPAWEPTPPRSATARPQWLVPALVVLGLLALGIAGAILLAGTGDGGESGGATTVIERTVTEQGTTQEVTVTVEAPNAEEPPPATQPSAGNVSLAQAKALQDESTAAMRRGDWATALALAQRALARLQGSGDIYEGYANYNVGRSLIELGKCEQGLPHIDRSEQIQGSRSEFDQARAKC